MSTVLITGAASGIGKASAIAFAKKGHDLMLCDIHQTALDSCQQSLSGYGVAVETQLADVGNSEQVQSLIDTTVERLGSLDIAINNAGIEGVMAPTADYPEDNWNRVIATNLTGVWLCMKHELSAMAAQKHGVIINISSILGLIGFANSCAYSAAKHGVVGLTKTAAIEYATQGIRINAICPGFIETPMVMERALNAGEDETIHQQISALHPVGRMGKAEEIADMLVMISSPEASFVTGTAIPVDGGFVAQ